MDITTQFKNSQKNGKGVFTWDDGAIYDGVNVIKGDCYISYDELIKNTDCKVVSYDNYENALEPRVDIFKLIKKHENETIDPHLLVPNYLKKTEAEENLNAKRN